MYNFYKTILGCGSNNKYRLNNSNGDNDRLFTATKTNIHSLAQTTIPNSYESSKDLTKHSNNNVIINVEDKVKKECCGSTISTRAQNVLSAPSVTIKYNQKVGADSYHPHTNPQGYVDLGLAENKLCEDIITEKLRTLPTDIDDTDLRYYPDVKGLPSFRNSLKTFFEREFDSREPLDADNIVVVSGLTALLESLAFALADEEDYIMTTSPYYYRVKNDLTERARVNVLEVPLIAKPKTRRVKPYTLDVEILEEALLCAEREGKRVKAVLLVNPNNPLGDVYTAQQLTHFLEFAARYQLHVIVDEIYALSVFDPDVTFTSVLSIYHPDRDKVHFLWGFSKDFGLSGYRCGVLYSNNTSVVKYMVSLGLYQQTAPLVQQRLRHIIDDTEWLHRVYLPALQDRLRKHYRMFHDALVKCGVDVHHSCGGIFIWMDASKYLSEQSPAAEEWLFDQFMKEKVFIVPGRACYSNKPGCYRIVFSLDENICIEGIRRIQNVFRRIRPPNIQNGF
uniref:Aminotransferase class I/classII large domain-containing protein n=1 Tax=Arion vulgaris TaxID=1028688 RepID=A0A0B7A105_9EUPU